MAAALQDRQPLTEFNALAIQDFGLSAIEGKKTRYRDYNRYTDILPHDGNSSYSN